MRSRVRRATRADHDAILAVDRVVFPDDEPVDLRARVWWMATVDGIVVGFGGMRVDTQIPVCYLSRAGVPPEFRGEGIHARLIARRIRHARNTGAREVQTYTIDNPASARNLARAGFAEFVPIPRRFPADSAQPTVTYWRLRCPT